MQLLRAVRRRSKLGRASRLALAPPLPLASIVGVLLLTPFDPPTLVLSCVVKPLQGAAPVRRPLLGRYPIDALLIEQRRRDVLG